jgi:hypothetical protein
MEPEYVGVWIPIIGIVFGVGIAAVSIVSSHREKVKRAELRHLERMAAIEKGIELAPEPDFDAPRQRTGSLRSAVMFILVGIVLYFALTRVADDDVALFGLLPVAIGAAGLIAWLVESRKKKD